MLAPSKRHRQLARQQQLAHLLAQAIGAGQAQRREQPEADRLAVAVAVIAGRRLDRVTDGVPEVQHLAVPAIALVRGDYGELRARAFEHDLLVEIVAGGDTFPQRRRRRSAPS